MDIYWPRYRQLHFFLSQKEYIFLKRGEANKPLTEVIQLGYS